MPIGNIGITQIQLRVTFGPAGASSAKYLTFYKGASNTISGSIGSMRGASIGALSVSNAYDRTVTLTFNRLQKTEDGLDQLFSSFTFGDDGGTPYLDMATSDSAVKMRLTNTRLAFVMGGTELAYFSDNKLYVTRLEAVNQISIGTSTNGLLDIVTTPTGVGFKWRS